MANSIAERYEHWRFFADGLFGVPKSFLIGHAVPPDRKLHASALNYWLDTIYNFGIIAVLPILCILCWTLYKLWLIRNFLRTVTYLPWR